MGFYIKFCLGRVSNILLADSNFHRNAYNLASVSSELPQLKDILVVVQGGTGEFPTVSGEEMKSIDVVWSIIKKAYSNNYCIAGFIC